MHGRRKKFLILLQEHNNPESKVIGEAESYGEAREVIKKDGAEDNGDYEIIEQNAELNPTRFKKGSEEAREFMRRLRAVKGRKNK